ncbi:LIM and SH3 domain protein F42H10.3 [Exaiptasia diaphana]|uniref:Uncharacterized protein n=1 Tax=Exaiptasia diaphana TaxID=2652724 RepID=A0A913Y9Z8_EXADI|nr:LIM and SH3 domain protein F42H10.3 [Exaiptasia diaphana]KXJ28327.1 LIM and SH3 domain protein 1 [Exaiptasia diaphana]
MNQLCAKCAKIVYPVEKFNCLDKIWHKGCFKCTVCNMTLNLKNYKGYNRYPYCQAHYPTTRHTEVADTVENRRLAQQTRQQSQIEYTKEFNKEKGSYTAIEDDPETRRHMKVSQNISGVAYRNEHGPHHQGRDSHQTVPQPVSRTRPPSTYVAIYDYTANDFDEVTILEGDTINNVHRIDDGWLEGRVQRTGKYGLFPANYVEPR